MKRIQMESGENSNGAEIPIRMVGRSYKKLNAVQQKWRNYWEARGKERKVFSKILSGEMSGKLIGKEEGEGRRSRRKEEGVGGGVVPKVGRGRR
jgi:hypothetical protein